MSDYKIFYLGYTGERHTRPGKGVTDLTNFFKFSRNFKKLKLNSRYSYVIENELADMIEEREKNNKFFTEKDLRSILLDYKMGKNGVKISEYQFNNFLIVANGDEPEEITEKPKQPIKPAEANKPQELFDQDYEQFAENEADDLLQNQKAELARAERQEKTRLAKEQRDQEIKDMGYNI